MAAGFPVAAFPIYFLSKKNAMRILASLIVILVLPLALIGTQSVKKAEAMTVAPAATAEYCNSRFDFCLDYSPTLLPRQEASANDDGLVLWAENNEAKVTANGAFNVFSWNPRELFDFNLENVFPGQPENAIVVSEVFGSDFFEVLLVSDGVDIFQKAFLKNGKYVLLTIEVPANRPLLMEELRQDISLNFVLQ